VSRGGRSGWKSPRFPALFARLPAAHPCDSAAIEWRTRRANMDMPIWYWQLCIGGLVLALMLAAELD
jgi:hypothetical protein